MSTPAPATTNVPAAYDAWPDTTGLPTSCVAHGAGRLLGVATVKLTPLLLTPLTVTTTGPLVAPAAPPATMPVALQLVGVAAVPLNCTVLVPCPDPKFVPPIVTGTPTGP